MIRNLGKLLMALCLLTVGGGIVAYAQIESDAAVEGNVPFTFVVGKTTLPAGKYQISAFPDTPGLIEIRGVNGSPSVVVEAENMEATAERDRAKSELVFNKVGDKYFLSQVWVAGNDTGSALVKSRMEKRLEGEGNKSERHSIAAILRHRKR